jgi:hypothetical protein
MSDIISLANSILELSSGINNAKLTKQVSELTLAAAQSEMEKAQLIKENTEMKEQLRVLREDRENPLVFNKKDNLYYQADDKKHLFPLCQHCYETERLRIHLTKRYVCPHCNVDFHLLSVHGAPVI